MNNTKGLFPIIFLVLCVLAWYSCYGWIALKNYVTTFQAITGVVVLYLLFSCYSEIFSFRHKIISLIFIGQLVTAIVEFLMYGQSIFGLYKVFLPSFAILIYFYLHKHRINPETVEKFLIISAVIYFCCWLIQIYEFPNYIFGMQRDDFLENFESRGFYRFWIPTKEHFPFLVFYFLCLFSIKRKFLYIIIAFIAFGCVVLHVARQIIIWTLLFAVIYFMIQNKKSVKSTIVLILISVISLNCFFSKSEVVSNLIEITENQQANIEDDIRKEASEYFIKESFKNPLTAVVGRGFPVVKGDGVSKRISFETSQGYYRSDVGFFGLLCDTGLWSVFLYILLLYKIVRMKVLSKDMYLKYYMFYVYGSFLFSHTLTTNIMFNMCAIYILEISMSTQAKMLVKA